MIIAREKRKENIAEYILYLFQIEDIIRSYKFNINLIEENIVQKFEQPEEVKDQIREWYADLIIMMKQEKIARRGHLQFLKSQIDGLNDFHLRLLDKAEETKYKDLYSYAYPNIVSFRDRSDDKNMNDVSVSLHGLYALLLMRLKGIAISPETKQAMQTFSNMLAYLSLRFKQYEEGKLEM